MKKLLVLLFTLIAVACAPSEIISQQEAAPPVAPADETSEELPQEGFDSDAISQASSGYAETSEMAVDSSYYYGGSIFENTTFINNATLPDIGATTTLLQRAYPDFSNGGIALATARELANRLGFTGPIYEEQMQVYESIDDSEMDDFEMGRPDFPRMFVAFDGDRRLRFHETGFTVHTERTEVGYEPITADSLIPLDQLTQTAETLLRDAGLIDRDYMTKRGWGNNIQFLPVIDGLSLQTPFSSVEFDANGEFVYLDYNSWALPTAYEEEPVVTAQAAFDLLIANPDRFTYDYTQLDQPYIDEGIPFGEPNSWQREIIDGQPYTLNFWLNVYQPVDGDGAPLIFGNNYQLIGDANMLTELAQTPNPILVRGVPNSDNGQKTFTVESWSRVDMFEEPYVQGIVDRQADAVWLDTEDGRRLRILDAPEELVTGMEIGLEYWSLENDEINWAHMFENTFQDIPTFEEPMPVEGDGEWQQPTIESITFNDIGQTYSYFYRGYAIEPYIGEGGEEFAEPVDEGELFAIHWVFKGITNEGRDITFYVPAVEMPEESDYYFEEAPPAFEVPPMPETEPPTESQ